MVTLQVYLNNIHSNEEKQKVNSIDASDLLISLKEIDNDLELEGGELDLTSYPNLEFIRIDGAYLKAPLTKLKLRDWPNLLALELQNNQLTSVDFLKDLLSHPERLDTLNLSYNNIKSDLEFLRPFVNLSYCFLGKYLTTRTDEYVNEETKMSEKRTDSKTYNEFYGSLEPIKNYIQLEKLCIAGTNIDSGLEYLPPSLVKANKKFIERHSGLTVDFQFDSMGKYLAAHNVIDSQPLKDDDRCKTIFEELKSFDYNIEAWQLVHPKIMQTAQPELFTDVYT